MVSKSKTNCYGSRNNSKHDASSMTHYANSKPHSVWRFANSKKAVKEILPHAKQTIGICHPKGKTAAL